MKDRLTVLHGHCLEELKKLKADSVHCVVTSPPYWALRDYGLPPVEWPTGWKGQHGLEPTPELYVEHEVLIFREVRRVLRKDGTCWVNLGDCYSASGCGGDTGESTLNAASRDASKAAKQSKSFRRDRAAVGNVKHIAAQGLQPKQLVGIHFPSAKSQRYFYDAEAIKESSSPDSHARAGRANKGYAPPGQEAHRGLAGPRASGVNPKANHDGRNGSKQNASFAAATVELLSHRNKRSVWTVTTAATRKRTLPRFRPT